MHTKETGMRFADVYRFGSLLLWKLDIEGLFWVCVLKFYPGFRYWRRKVSLCSKKITEIPWIIPILFHLKAYIPFLGFRKNVLKERFDTVRHISTNFANRNLEQKLHFCILHLKSCRKFRTRSRFYRETSKNEKNRRNSPTFKGKARENSQQ